MLGLPGSCRRRGGRERGRWRLGGCGRLKDLARKQDIRAAANQGPVCCIPPRPLKCYVHIRCPGTQLGCHDGPQGVPGEHRNSVRRGVRSIALRLRPRHRPAWGCGEQARFHDRGSGLPPRGKRGGWHPGSWLPLWRGAFHNGPWALRAGLLGRGRRPGPAVPARRRNTLVGCRGGGSRGGLPVCWCPLRPRPRGGRLCCGPCHQLYREGCYQCPPHEGGRELPGGGCGPMPPQPFQQEGGSGTRHRECPPQQEPNAGNGRGRSQEEVNGCLLRAACRNPPLCQQPCPQDAEQEAEHQQGHHHGGVLRPRPVRSTHFSTFKVI